MHVYSTGGHDFLETLVTYSDCLCVVSVTWNGAILTGPTLIYHDELILDGTNPTPFDIGNVDRPGALVCRSETRVRAAWRATNGSFFSDTTSHSGTIRQIRTDIATVPSLSRLSRGTTDVETDPDFNGLFTCRVNVDGDLADVLANFVHVGIYARGEGEKNKQQQHGTNNNNNNNHNNNNNSTPPFLPQARMHSRGKVIGLGTYMHICILLCALRVYYVHINGI